MGSVGSRSELEVGLSASPHLDGGRPCREAGDTPPAAWAPPVHWPPPLGFCRGGSPHVSRPQPGSSSLRLPALPSTCVPPSEPAPRPQPRFRVPSRLSGPGENVSKILPELPPRTSPTRTPADFSLDARASASSLLNPFSTPKSVLKHTGTLAVANLVFPLLSRQELGVGA